MRVLLTRGSMNRSQRDGGLPPDSVVQDEDTILADSERVVAKHHQRGEDAMVQIALAPCSPFSVTTSLMRATAALADKLDVRLHTHLAETEDENKFCEQMLWLPAARLSRAMRLAQCADLARPRHHLQRRRDEAARQGQDHHQPLRLQQPDAGLRLLPGLRDGGGGGRASGSASTARPRTTNPI